VHERNRQIDKQDYYGNTAICNKVHRAEKSYQNELLAYNCSNNCQWCPGFIRFI